MSGTEGARGRRSHELFVRARAAVRAQELDLVVVALEEWASLLGGAKAVFDVIGLEAIRDIDGLGVSMTPEAMAEAVAERSSWVPGASAAIIEPVVRAVLGEPNAVAGFPAEGVSLLCLLILDWLATSG